MTPNPSLSHASVPPVEQTLCMTQASAEAARDFIDAVIERIHSDADTTVWTLKLDRQHIHAQLQAAYVKHQQGIPQPLLGIPFAIKDNIDIAGHLTTNGCPAFAYTAAKTATAVQRLLDAGAIWVGKTNMDQFATGLVGTRSPYGICRNPFDPDYVAGGSSSGSALAVARGLVCFSLGTDTAGSGRVPAAFNNIVGLKPTRGLISTAGVCPACRSLDCVSIFALSCGDADIVRWIMQGYDSADPYSRRPSDYPNRYFNLSKFRFGVPAAHFLEFFGDRAAEAKFHEAVNHLLSLGGERIEIDYAPFSRAAKLLYEGPWVAERYAAVGQFIEASPDAVLPVTRQIISRGRTIDAVSTFKAQHELESIRAEARAQWDRMDVLLLPTTGTIPTIEQVAADPIGPNTDLGYYTNFVNLLDLCAVAVPNGFLGNGLPAGVSLIGPAGVDDALLELGDRLHRLTSTTTGAAGVPLPPPRPASDPPSDWVKLAVVGAHLSGQPLNHQLTTCGGRLVRTCRTAADYRLFALPGTVPPKPGLIRVPAGIAGVPQEIEIWSLPPAAFGAFVAAIPAPLGIGTIRTEDGQEVKSFLCEHHAIAAARDISSFGGWRAFLKASAR